MLNKELLMMGSASLDPVLSIYISPWLSYLPSVSGRLSSGEPFYVRYAGETTFKFSEIELTARITISYYEDAQLTTSNLKPAFASYSGGVERAPAIMLEAFHIRDWTRPASIWLE